MFLLPVLKDYFLINLTLCNTSSYLVDLIMCENWGLNWRGSHPEKIHFFFFLSQKVLSISWPLSDSLAHYSRLFHLPSSSSFRQSWYWKFLRNDIHFFCAYWFKLRFQGHLLSLGSLLPPPQLNITTNSYFIQGLSIFPHW